MKVKVGGITDTGMARKHNEDSFFVNEEGGLLVVADGVGGQSSGEVASKMAVELINDYITKFKAENRPYVGSVDESLSEETNRLASAVRLANQVIYESSKSNPSLKGMCTTVVTALIKGKSMSIAHVGDSRAYLLRSGTMMQLTDDHSVVSEQVKKGLMTESQARDSGMKNIITRALGLEATVEVDLEEVEVMDGDRVLLCSDGLTTMVPDDTILDTAAGLPDPEEACRRLVVLANENGGKDNVTVVLGNIRKNGLSWIKNIFSS